MALLAIHNHRLSKASHRPLLRRKAISYIQGEKTIIIHRRKKGKWRAEQTRKSEKHYTLYTIYEICWKPLDMGFTRAASCYPSSRSSGSFFAQQLRSLLLIFIDNPFNSLSSSAAAGSVYIYIRKARIYSKAAAYDEG